VMTSPSSEPRNDRRPVRLTGRDLALFTLALIVAGATSVWLGQDLNFDLVWYHYYNGYALVAGRLDQDIAPVGWHTYLNPTVDALYYLGMNNRPPRLFGFLLGAVHGLNFPLLYLLGLSVLGGADPHHLRRRALLAALVGSVGPSALSLLGSTMGNNLLSIPVLGGLLALLWPLRDGRSPLEVSPWPRGRLLGAGALCGAATGLKLTALSAFLSLVLTLMIFAVATRPVRRLARSAAWLGAGGALGFLATGGYWSWALFARFGNPVFPFANQIFRSPFFEPEFYRDTRWAASGVWDYLRPPLDIALGRMERLQEIGGRDIRFLLLFAALAACALVAVTRWRRGSAVGRATTSERFVVLFWLIGYGVWATTFYYYRYMTTLEMLAPLVLFVLLRFLVPRRALTAILVCVSLVVVASVRVDSWGRGGWQDDWFGIDLPRLARRPGSLVLLAGGPIAFAIPSFPIDARFAHLTGIQSKGGTALIDRMIAEAIEAHDGPLLIMATFRVDADAQDPEHRRPRWVYNPEQDARPLVAPFGLSLTNRCAEIPTRRGRLYLCELERSSSPPRSADGSASR
jgi:hypothetical protein